jgi:hypothetical protein
MDAERWHGIRTKVRLRAQTEKGHEVRGFQKVHSEEYVNEYDPERDRKIGGCRSLVLGRVMGGNEGARTERV